MKQSFSIGPRRRFLGQLGGVMALGAALPPAFLARATAQAKQDRDGRILVLVELAGGNDGLNTVVPFTNDEYYRQRPTIAQGRGAVHKLNDELGLHPAMQGFKKLFDDRKLAVVQGVGYPNPNRSHFRSMDIWHTAVPDQVDKRTGWLGRALDRTAEQHSGRLPAMALGMERLPLALVSTKFYVPMVRSLEDYKLQLGEGPGREERGTVVEALADQTAAAGTELEFLRRTALSAYSSARRLEEVTAQYQPAAEYPENGLGQRLKTVAQLIAGDLGVQVFYVSLGGFDTHADQTGAHNGLMNELSTALTAFQQDLVGHKLADRVLTCTFSEFGRRVKENGSLGTDHGAASQMFLLGNAVKPGIHGVHPSLTRLDQGDLIHHTDFRRVYATLLEKWLDWPTAQVLAAGHKPMPIL